MPVSILYRRKYFDKDLQKSSLHFVKDIQNELIDSMEQATWLDEETRQSAIKKAEWIQAYIDLPDETHDRAKLDEYYEDLEIDPNDFFSNLLELEKFDTNRTFNDIQKPAIKLDWDLIKILNLANVDAFNRYGENSIRM